MGSAGSYTFPEKSDGEDVYHCAGACRYYDSTPHSGDIFITISTWLAYNDVEGSVTFAFNEPFPRIQRAQLDAVRAMYSATCAPYQAPRNFTGLAYAKDVSTDTDTMPYCDWLPGNHPTP